MKLKIGIVLGSTRNGRSSEDVGNWVLSKAKEFKDAEFELVDIKEFNLPFLGTLEDQKNVMSWNEKINELDGFIFVVAEYNHSITGALKNALDSAREAWADKPAGIISYGSAGGARAAEHLKGILVELQIASVRTQVLFSLFDDFENFSKFNPRSIHDENLNTLFDQVNVWGNALKTLR